MKIQTLRALLLGMTFALLCSGIASAATSTTPKLIAQATPEPKATQNPFSYSAYVRSFYFTRQNNPQLSPKNPLNQATFNTGVSLHGAYRLGSGFSLGATYLYASPFDGTCNSAAAHAAGLPCVKPNAPGAPASTNPDDTLPGFNLSTLYEAYLQYASPSLFARLGDQVINTPWANSSDSRLKPVAFRGGDLSYKFNKHLTGELMYMNRFESRVDSDFVNGTLLTANKLADAPGAGANLHIAPYSSISTNGFAYGRIGYNIGAFTANLHDYAFQNIANALWLDAKYAQKSYVKPYVAVQAGTESSSGNAVIGKINSQVFGIQGGVTPWKNVDLSVGYDDIPQKSDTLTLPANVTCSGGSIGGSAVFAYFLPAGGTPQCSPGVGGATTVYYGGWASPYTDSYATDPLFTTSISQGMADRRSAGQAIKIAATANLFHKRIRLISSRAWYKYGNAIGGVAPTQETDFDATYFFSKVKKGPYRGLSIRQRFAERTQQFFTTNPDFKYERTQLEYDF